MKIVGWIFIGIAILTFIISIISISEYPEGAGKAMSASITNGVVGFFLVHTANKKIQEKQKKDEWENK